MPSGGPFRAVAVRGAWGGAASTRKIERMEPSDPQGLLDSFAAYLRRQLGPGGPSVVQVRLGDAIRSAPGDAGIAVVAGRRSPLGERLFALRSGMRPQWRGRVRVTPDQPGIEFTVWDRWSLAKVGKPPASFDVLAIVTTFNEAEIVEQTLQRLVDAGVRVHVIDNWSTDGTDSIVEGFLAPGRVSMEKFPSEGPTQYFELRSLLRRLGEVAHASQADWVIHHDCDEIHESAWPSVSLREGLWAVDRWGFNCVDHAAVDFRPVNESWKPRDDLATTFEWFEFGTAEGHFTLLKAWKPQAAMVTNTESGGHSAEFEGRRIFPYKFPIRHYSLRSSAHARRKLFQERANRWDPEELAMGWHCHYDEYHEGSSFLWDRSNLYRWSTVDDDLLVQRLSGVWLPNNPRPEEAAPEPTSAI